MPMSTREDQRKYQREWVAARRKIFVDAFGGCCKDCGRKTNLDFHHRDPKTAITHRFWSWSLDRVAEEVTKCDLLCEDCHQARHREMHRATLVHGTSSMYRVGCRCYDCVRANSVRVSLINNRRNET